jgi:16S rRNA (guanine527-N7)-methyltransferase
MKIGSAEWCRLIIDGAASWGVALETAHVGLFARHAEELLKWNAVTNLTAITGPEEIARNHFLDSLAPAGLVAPGSDLLDVGTGGGFPGLPLHVLIPGLRTTLLDAVRKKVSFLRHALRALELKGVEAVHGRVEQLARQPGQAGRYDVILSRAFSAVPPFARAALPMLKPHGRVIALKGKVSPAELDELRKTAGAGALGAVLSVELRTYVLPGLKSERTLVVLSRSAATHRRAP